MARVAVARVPGLAARISDRPAPARHSAMVRVTHWINAVSFLGLAVSGFAILLAHPRFYWGEAGGLGTPSVLDLPLPFMKGGPSGWGRNLHFLTAWVCVANGAVYAVSGMLTRHFRRNLIPAKAEIGWASISRAVANHLRLKLNGAEAWSAYNVLQKLTYLAVVFVLLPLMIWTGFAMSPAIVSVAPVFVTIVGGQQSARTIHFFAADLLVVFLGVHLAMVGLSGFSKRMEAMITGRNAGQEEDA